MKRRQVKNQVKPDFFVQRFKPAFFGIEQGVCNKKNGRKQSQVELAFVFWLISQEQALFFENIVYSWGISADFC